MSRLKMHLSVAAVIFFAAARSGIAAPLNIINGNFESPALGNSGYAYFDDFPLATSGWTDGSHDEDGVCQDSIYVPNGSDPDGGTQCAFLAGNFIAQQIGNLNPGGTYTVNFSSSGGPTVTAELVDGSPTGTVLAQSPAYAGGAGQTWAAHSALLTPSGGTSGDALYLEFVTSGYQAYVDGISGTVTPEPASFGLLGLGVVGLLTRRRYH